mmetsp:Transcript_121504/g.389060  ORF Transcript_121504/g.389060 Transcript_121504/m.389060 type:complete len:165 (-) Transcript_121504:360-854(-)
MRTECEAPRSRHRRPPRRRGCEAPLLCFGSPCGRRWLSWIAATIATTTSAGVGSAVAASGLLFGGVGGTAMEASAGMVAVGALTKMRRKARGNAERRDAEQEAASNRMGPVDSQGVHPQPQNPRNRFAAIQSMVSTRSRPSKSLPLDFALKGVPALIGDDDRRG